MQGTNQALTALLIEPDFVQQGPMSVQIRGRANARAAEVDSEIRTFPAVPSVPEEQVAYFKDQRRQLRFRFISNVIGGDYQMGQCLAHVVPADGTILGGITDLRIGPESTGHDQPERSQFT